MQSKTELLEAGIHRISEFCVANSLEVPQVEVVPSKEWPFAVPAYYRPTYIKICLEKSSCIGTAGRAWSYPGYVADRTPYGILAHEVGHHADRSRSSVKASYFGNYSHDLRTASREAQITSYSPNDAEWFAEIFRLFITNPDLLRRIRPKTYALLRENFEPVETRDWLDVLEGAPPRTIAAAKAKFR